MECMTHSSSQVRNFCRKETIMDIMKDSYYLVSNDTYGDGKRIILTKNITGLSKSAMANKVKVVTKEGMFILLRDNENADPLLICTNGFIEFI